MKYLKLKFLLMFFALAMAIPPAWAGEETVTFSEQGYANQTDMTQTGYTGTNFSLSFAQGDGSNGPKYYTSGAAIRMYPKNSMTVTSSKTITKIVITFGSSDATNAITTDVVTYENGTWTGSSKSVKFTVGGTKDNRRFSAVTVTYEEYTPPSTDPWVTVNPSSLTINDVVGEENKFDVSARNIRDWQNLGVTPNNGFSVSGTSTPSTWYNDNGNTGFYSNSEHSADGTVTVTYEGRELIATGNVNCGTDGAEPKNVAVSYRSDVYIITNHGTSTWDYNGTLMTYDPDDKVYTGTVTVPAGACIMFSRKTGETYDWNEYGNGDNRLFFGAQMNNGQDWPYGDNTAGSLGMNPSITGKYCPIKFPKAGVYTITIDPTDKTFSIASTSVNSIQEAYDFENGQFTFMGNAVVTFKKGSNLWIRDDSGSGLIYQSGLSNFVNGDVLDAGWKAETTVHNGIPEFQNASGIKSSTNNGVVQPIELTSLEAGDVNKYVSMNNLTITHVDGQNYYFEIGNEEFCMRDNFNLIDDALMQKDHVYNVVGAVTIYQNKPQLYLFSATDVTPATLTVTLDPEEGSAYTGKTIEVTVTTDPEAEFQATCNDANATVTNTSSGFTITSNTPGIYTVSVYATDGELEKTVTGTYTFTQAPESTGDIFEKVTSKELVDGGRYILVYEGGPAAMGTVGQKGEPVTGIILDTEKNQVDLAGKTVTILTAHETGTSGRYTFEIESGKYLGYGSSTNFVTNEPASSNKAQWDVQNDGSLINVSTINTQTVRAILYSTASGGKFGPYAISNVNNTSYFYAYLYQEVKAEPVDPELSFVDADEQPITEPIEAKIGEDITEPTLVNPHSVAVTYSSSDETLATVNASTGAVTLLKTGLVTITATSTATDEYSVGTATYQINISKKNVTLVFGETPEDVYVDNEVTLTVTGAPEGVNVTFECTPEGAVTFDGNKATFKTEGPVTITAKTAATNEYNAGEVSKTFNVQAKTTPTLTFTPDKVELYVGDTFTAPTLNGLPEGATVVYTVENENPEVVVATVENNVVAITGTAGKATVTATYAGSNQYNNTSASYPITISKKDVTLAFGDTPDIYVGNEVTLTVTGAPEGVNVTFECTPEGAVTFEGNKATFNTEGEVTITAKTAATDKYNAGEVSKTFNVQAKKEAGLSFGENPNVEITLGDTFTAPQLVNPYNLPVTWTSSNPDVATVDQDGNVTLVAGAIGNTTITATYTTGEGSGYETGSARYTITVNDVVVALAAPTFAPAAGTYTEPKEVAIACATPGVTIEYTIDGVTKTYEGPFLVDRNCTVTATAMMGTRTVYTPATSSATYTINAADAATIADDYYFLQSNAAEVSGKYANVAGRRTLNFVADADKQAGTVFRIETGEGGAVKTLRSQAVDLQGYANRAMAYVPKAIELVLSTLANSSLGDPETPGTGILGENGLDLILNKFYEGFDYNLYVEQGTEGTYRIYGRTPSMQHVVDFYHENTAQVEEKLPMLEGYINQVLDKIRSKIPAPYDANVVVPFSLKTVRDRIADKYGITLIDPTQDLMGFYRQVLNNKEYVWDFAYQTAMMYVDVIKQTGTYQSLPNEYKLLVQKMEKVRPDTKYYIIERGNELDYISENNTEIISNDPRTLWTLTKRENFTVNVPEANKLNDSYYTTLYTDFGYELRADVKAYAVTGIDENDVAQLTEITGAIPAQTPVLLKADAAGDKVLTLKKESRGGAIEGNLLEGPDYLITEYQIKTPAVVSLFNMAQGFVPAETLADYEYLQLRYSGTVNNKYFWNVNSDLEDLQGDCVVRSLAVKDGKLAFSDHWTTENNKAFLVSDTKPVIYLEKDTLAAPTFSPVPGSYTVDNGQNVTITITAEDDATIKYSTDGGKTWNTYEGPIAASDDMTIVAKAEKDGMIASDEVTAVYVIDEATVLPDVPAMKGYFQIKNNGNNKYANIAGRKTLNFTNDIDKAAGTVIWLETNDKGQVQSIRSQAADLQRYADRVVEYYVPKAVELVVEKLHADGAGNILGENGLDAIMDKFNESFDHHLYVEPAEGGYRIYGKTPSMQPVVDFYREHTAQVEAKLPMLESFINSALDKLKQTIGGGSTIFQPFSLLNIWERMGGTLTKPEDDASIMAFYREVLNNKNYVWDFAYQTATFYLENLKNHKRWPEVEAMMGEYAQYFNKLEQVRPDFKYYIVADGDKPDFISEGNVDIINNADRTIWTVEPRTTFTVNIAGEQFGCPLATNGVGGYFTTNYTDFAYTLPEGVTAYKVTGVNDEGEAVLESLTGTIPAQTPVLLVAKGEGDYSLKLSAEAGTADISGNLLVGPDYLINKYDFKTEQVQSIFDLIKDKLGESFYNNYVAQYEYLADLNSGTVNNKYFWSVDNYLDDLQDDCVVRSLATDENGKLAFSEHWKTETNKAFLVSDTFDVITLPSFERGDVNHDGEINIKDVSDLIDRLLGNEANSCPYCSDVNCDDDVNIKDVSDLIDFLLNSGADTHVDTPTTDPEEGDGN